MDLRETDCEVAGTGISGVEPSGSATRELISKMDFREIGCEDGRWMELAEDRVQWRALLLAVFCCGVCEAFEERLQWY
jgi:hypothetical protein